MADVRRGDSLAFGLLYERWFDGVYEAAHGVLGDPQAAGEVALETFDALWHHLHQLHDAEAFGSWALETGRAFALDRRDTGRVADRTPPLPLFVSIGQMSAAVSDALVARGVPTGAGLAGSAGPVAPIGFMGRAVGDGGSAMNMPSAGTAGGAGSSGGSILGGSVANVTMAAPPAGVTLATNETFRPHRYDPPKPSVTGALADSGRLIAGGLAVVTAAVAIGCLLWLVNRDDGGAEVLGELQTPLSTTSSTADSNGGAAGAQPGGEDVLGATTSSIGDAATSSTADQSATTPSGPSTTRRPTTTAGSSSTAPESTTSSSTAPESTTSSSTAPSSTAPSSTAPSTTAPTSSTSEPTSTTAASTTSTTAATTTSTTAATTSTTSTPPTIPEPEITSFRLIRGNGQQCPRDALPFTVEWSVANATRIVGVIATEQPRSFGPAVSGTSRPFCAPSGVSVSLTAFGEGGQTSDKLST